MKRFVLFMMASVCMAGAASAQITKGTVLLGGGVSFTTAKSEAESSTASHNQKQHSIQVMPSAGLAINENLMAGVSLLYGHAKSITEGAPHNPYTNYFGGGIFLRKYFPVARNFYIHGEPSLAFSTGKGKYINGSEAYTVKSLDANLSLSPGLTYALSKRFHIEAGLSNLVYISYDQTKYNYSTSKSTGKSLSLSSSLSSATPFHIGFRVVLPG